MNNERDRSVEGIRIVEVEDVGDHAFGEPPAALRPGDGNPGSWRAVAERLGDRLSIHAFCDQHPVTAEDPDCPFCLDRRAYRLFVAKLGNNR